MNLMVQQGWQCPCCSKVYSPTTSMCFYCPPKVTVASNSTPKRTWVSLTYEEFLEACQIAERGNYLVAFQRIQAKLKKKNT